MIDSLTYQMWTSCAAALSDFPLQRNALMRQPRHSAGQIALDYYYHHIDQVSEEAAQLLFDYSRSTRYLWPWIPYSIPERITASRKRGYTMPENTVCVDRSSRFSNPFKPESKEVMEEAEAMVNLLRTCQPRPTDEEMARDWLSLSHYIAVCKHRHYLFEHPELISSARKELRGKNLATYCSDSHASYASNLLLAANDLQWVLYHFGFYLESIRRRPKTFAEQFTPGANPDTHIADHYTMVFFRYSTSGVRSSVIFLSSQSEVITSAHSEELKSSGNELIGQPVDDIFFKFPYEPFDPLRYTIKQ